MSTGGIFAGDAIEVRDAFGVWRPAIARSSRFVNHDDAPPGVTPWSVIEVELADGERVNWPFADVRRTIP